MANYTAADVKRLRELTGAGMLDCKNALVEADGDFDKAVELLRIKGAKDVGKRAERATAEGLVAAKDGALIELNSETDFVAKNAEFQALADQIVAAAAAAEGRRRRRAQGRQGRRHARSSRPSPTCRPRSARSSNCVAPRTSTAPSRRTCTSGPPTCRPRWACSSSTPVDGKEAAHAVALQIAALKAKYLTRDEVPEDIVANERRIAEETAKEEGKPEQALPKIVEGRLNGFFKDVVLLDQPSVSDNKKTVKALLDEAGVTVTRFVAVRGRSGLTRPPGGTNWYRRSVTRIHAFGDDALGDLDAVGLVEALRAGTVSATELVEAAIARTEAVNPALNGLAYEAFDRARAAPTRPAAYGGYFDGVPTFIKDNVAVAGMPTMQGTDAWDPRPMPADGDFARVFLSTGLVPLGKTQMSEFGFSGVGRASADRAGAQPVESPTAPRVRRRRGRARSSPRAWCRSRMPTTAAARSGSRRPATVWSGSSRPAAGCRWTRTAAPDAAAPRRQRRAHAGPSATPRRSSARPSGSTATPSCRRSATSRHAGQAAAADRGRAPNRLCEMPVRSFASSR